MAPCVAMMAETPQIDDPTASSVVSFGRHERQRERHLDQHQPQRDSAQPQHVTDQEARAQQHNSGLEPELVGCHAGAKQLRHANGVGNRQPQQNGPQNVFDVRQHQVMRFAIARNRLLDDLARVTHREQQQNSGYKCEEPPRQRYGSRLR